MALPGGWDLLFSLGGLQLVALVLVISRNSALAVLLAPCWFYAVGFMYPVSRFAAGVSPLSRSHLAVPVLGIFATCAGVALIGGSAIWQYQTGAPLEMPQVYVVFARLGFLLVVATFIALRMEGAWSAEVRFNKRMKFAPSGRPTRKGEAPLLAAYARR